MSTKSDGGVIVLCLIAALLTIPLGIFYVGYILTCFWAWFIMPVFVTVKPLTVHMAFGLSLTVNFFLLFIQREKFDFDDKDTVGSWFSKTLVHYAAYTIAWGIGWVWHTLQWFNYY